MTKYVAFMIIIIATLTTHAIAGSGTAFTYQGRLLEGAANEPANGVYFVEFGLWNALNGGNQIGSTITFNSLSITDGLFTVELQFGSNVFDNTDRWLEIAVDGVLLNPRQPITRTPYSTQTRGIFVNQQEQVFIGRTIGISGAEYFGFNAPVKSGYAGMYISTDGQDAWPFYGYAAGGNTDMWHYYDGSTGSWHLNNGGSERLTVQSDGDVGIGTTNPFYPLHVVGNGFRTIYVQNTDSVGQTWTVWADSVSPEGGAILGRGAATGPSAGVVGESISPDGYGVFSFGDYGGVGAKYFVQPHPYDPSKEIRFVCLEGNESGTYFRGSTRLENGRAYIDVPEEFRLVSETEGLTVQVTARGPATLWVESVDLDRIVVAGKGDDVDFDYFVNGVRRGFAELELTRENYAYVPKVRGVPYGTQFRKAHRQILVDNGILNPDFTPNEATAAMMGWTLRDPEPNDQPEQESISSAGETK